MHSDGYYDERKIPIAQIVAQLDTDESALTVNICAAHVRTDVCSGVDLHFTVVDVGRR